MDRNKLDAVMGFHGKIHLNENDEQTKAKKKDLPLVKYIKFQVYTVDFVDANSLL